MPKFSQISQSNAAMKLAESFAKDGFQDSATRYYKVAAKNGSVEAMSILAYRYMDGIGTDANLNVGLDYANLAAKNGRPSPLCYYHKLLADRKQPVPESMLYVSLAYLTGVGININKEKHVYYLKKYCQHMRINFNRFSRIVKENQENLSKYRHVSDMCIFLFEQLPNIDESIKLLTPYAVDENPDAMNALAKKLIKRDQHIDELRAMPWYIKSAELGNVHAMWELAKKYISQQGAKSFPLTFGQNIEFSTKYCKMYAEHLNLDPALVWLELALTHRSHYEEDQNSSLGFEYVISNFLSNCDQNIPEIDFISSTLPLYFPQNHTPAEIENAFNELMDVTKEYDRKKFLNDTDFLYNNLSEYACDKENLNYLIFIRDAIQEGKIKLDVRHIERFENTLSILLDKSSTDPYGLKRTTSSGVLHSYRQREADFDLPVCRAGLLFDASSETSQQIHRLKSSQ